MKYNLERFGAILISLVLIIVMSVSVHAESVAYYNDSDYTGGGTYGGESEYTHTTTAYSNAYSTGGIFDDIDYANLTPEQLAEIMRQTGLTKHEILKLTPEEIASLPVTNEKKLYCINNVGDDATEVNCDHLDADLCDAIKDGYDGVEETYTGGDQPYCVFINQYTKKIFIKGGSDSHGHHHGGHNINVSIHTSQLPSHIYNLIHNSVDNRVKQQLNIILGDKGNKTFKDVKVHGDGEVTKKESKDNKGLILAALAALSALCAMTGGGGLGGGMGGGGGGCGGACGQALSSAAGAFSGGGGFSGGGSSFGGGSGGQCGGCSCN